MELNDADIVVGPYFAESNGMYLTEESRLYDSDYVPYIAVGTGPKYAADAVQSDYYSFWSADAHLLLKPDTGELWYVDSKVSASAGKKFKLDAKEYQPIIDKIMEEEPKLYEFPDFTSLWSTFTNNGSGTTITTSPSTNGTPLIWQNGNCAQTTTGTYPITWTSNSITTSSNISGSYFNYNI